MDFIALETRAAFPSAVALTAACLASASGLAPPSLTPLALAACSAALVRLADKSLSLAPLGLRRCAD